MIIEYIRYTFEDVSRGADLVDAYTTAATALNASPECLGYELSVCVDDPRSWILRIEWESAEAHLQQFRKGPEFPTFFSSVKGFVKDISEMRHYQLSTVRSTPNDALLTSRGA